MSRPPEDEGVVEGEESEEGLRRVQSGSITRRRLLQALVSAGVVGLAGCNTFGSDRARTPMDTAASDPVDPTKTPTDEPTPTESGPTSTPTWTVPAPETSTPTPVPEWSNLVRFTRRGQDFGWSSDIDGDLAIVGDPGYDFQVPGFDEEVPAAGRAYVFFRGEDGWRQEAILEPSGERDPRESFGVNLALDGNTALVGAPVDENETDTDVGTAYVFEREGTTWHERARLRPDEPAVRSTFGMRLGLSGDTAVVSTWNNDPRPEYEEPGEAHVFRRSKEGWHQEATLAAEDGSIGDLFGSSVAVGDGTAVVGAYEEGERDGGAAYVFGREGTAWTQEAKLTPSRSERRNDLFGVSAAIEGGTAIVGALFDEGGQRETKSGRAYVFTREGGEWREQDRLEPPGAIHEIGFGDDVALSGNTTVVGAMKARNGIRDSDEWQGAVYVFERNGETWRKTTKFLPSDLATWDKLGESVGVSGNTVVAGASMYLSSKGKAYLFDV